MKVNKANGIMGGRLAKAVSLLALAGALMLACALSPASAVAEDDGGAPAPETSAAPALTTSAPVSGEASAPQSRGAVLSKDEVVYAVLSGDGTPETAYIVNRFLTSAPGEFTDYGDYSKATALSAPETVKLDGDAVTFNLPDATFSYQGDMKDPALPWLVDIAYYLNGEEISADGLAGKSGALKMDISVSRNPAVDNAYYDNYLMQITVALDGGKCSGVDAPDASVAAAGSDRAVAFTALPGKDSTYSLSADVTDFEMDGIQFAALPFTMAFDLPDADEMTEDMDELVDAVGDIDEGVAKLADGTTELKDGVAEFSGGAKEISGGAEKLAEGSSDVATGLKKLDEGSAGLVSGSALIGDNLKKMADSMAPLSGGVDLSALFAMLPGFDQTPSGMALIAQINALNEGLSQINAGMSALSGSYSSFQEGLVSYTDGVGALSENYGKLDESLSQLSKGMSDLADASAELSKGTSELAKGISELAEGTSELHDGVSGMPDEVKEQIDEFAKEYDKSAYVPKSFASGKNADVSIVQFVFRTEEIAKPEEVKPADKEPENTTFLSRLLSLFGL